MVALPGDQAPRPQAKSLACPKCGSALAIRGLDHTVAVACGQCSSVIDARDPNHQILSTYEARKKTDPRIPLGTRGTFSGTAWEAIGFLRRRIVVDGFHYTWSEYLLFNPYKGFRWLTEFSGHWALVETAREKPVPSGGDVVCEGKTYKHFQRSRPEVVYVLGEFTWEIKAGEKTELDDYVMPPYILSAEKSGREINWSIGEYIEPEVVWKAFNLSGSPPPRLGAFACQPNPAGSLKRASAFFGLFAAAALAVAIASTALGQNRPVHSQTFVYDASETEKAKISEEFTLGGRSCNVSIRTQASVDNHWIYLHMALINLETDQALDFGREVAYYQGHDSDGSWSEGKKNDEVILGHVPPGRYYLRIEPESDAQNVNYTVQVVRDVPRPAYFFLTLLLLSLPLLIQGLRWYGFEKRRWNESDHPWGSSDDDDSDDISSGVSEAVDIATD